MTQYELTFLLNEEIELKQIKGFITSLEGKILKEDDWGEKILAYPIKKNSTAHFYNVRFEMDKNKLADLKRKLNFDEKLIRYLLLKVEEE